MTYDSMRQFSQLEYGKEKELTYLLNEQHHEARVADVGSFIIWDSAKSPTNCRSLPFSITIIGYQIRSSGIDLSHATEFIDFGTRQQRPCTPVMICTLRLAISRGILPSTSLVGSEFVKACLEAVKRMSNTPFLTCLIDLWVVSTCISLESWYRIWWSKSFEHDVRSRPEMWNVDLKLSISRQQPGTDAGSIPFMTIDLLTGMARLYRYISMNSRTFYGCYP